MIDESLWENPPAAYRPQPFWFMNDGLEPESMDRMLRELRAGGVGGVALHPRVGLEVEYLSEEFWARMRKAVQSCSRLGLDAWIYDEYNWPSGAAGGRLLRQRPELMQKGLVHRVRRPGGWPMPPDNARLYADCGRVRFWVKAADWVTPSVTGAPWTRPLAGCLDYMNPEAARAFIELVLEEYRRRLGEYFGTVIKGVFTDEPANYMGIPWTESMDDEYRARYGRELVDDLPSLALRVGHWGRVRCEYYRLAGELLARGFFEPMAEWCRSNRLRLTGHLFGEEDVESFTCTGVSFYRTMKPLSVPGVDFLGHRTGYGDDPTRTMDAPFLGPIMARSLARQLDRGRVMAECFGGNGWDAPLDAMANAAHYLMALGVNLVMPHAAFLSIKGLRKRDYPSSHFRPQPWWDDYPDFAAELGRTALMLAAGRGLAETAALWPDHALWRLNQPGVGKPGDFTALKQRLLRLLESMLRNGIEYDLAFEERIIEGGYGFDGDALESGEARYRAVVVPDAGWLPAEVWGFLTEYADRGGRVVFVGRRPGPPQGPRWRFRDNAAVGFKRVVRVPGVGDLAPALERLGVRTGLKLTGPGASRTLTASRQARGCNYYYLANISSRRAELGFLVPGAGNVEFWDPGTGRRFSLDGEPGPDGSSAYRLELEGRAAGFVVASAPLGQPRPVLKPRARTRTLLSLENFRFETASPNILPIPDWEITAIRVPARGYKPPARLHPALLGILKLVDRAVDEDRGRVAVKRFHGMDQVGPWGLRHLELVPGFAPEITLTELVSLLRKAADSGAIKRFASRPEPGARLRLRAGLEIRVMPHELELVFEDLGAVQGFRINGRRPPPPAPRPVWDRANLAVDIRDLARVGENLIEWRTRVPDFPDSFNTYHGIEPVALVGGFGVSRGAITARPGLMRVGDWRGQGLPHYFGEGVYSSEFWLDEADAGSQLLIRLHAPDQTCSVLLNGRRLGQGYGARARFETLGAQRPGYNIIEIRVRNTVGNFLGPSRPSGLLAPVKILTERV